MTEFEEICQGYKLMDYHRELEFQCNGLGFSPSDPFPMYLRKQIDRIAIEKSNYNYHMTTNLKNFYKKIAKKICNETDIFFE